MNIPKGKKERRGKKMRTEINMDWLKDLVEREKIDGFITKEGKKITLLEYNGLGLGNEAINAFINDMIYSCIINNLKELTYSNSK